MVCCVPRRNALLTCMNSPRDTCSKHYFKLRVSEEATNAHGERNVLPRCEVSRWEFSNEKWVAVLIRTGTAPVAIHGNIRLSWTSCSLHPVFQHFSRKYQHPPTDIAAWHSVRRGRSAFWVYAEKTCCEILNLLQITYKKVNMGL